MSVLSRLSDLTRFRLARIEPEPMVPLRVQSVGPRDWVPPTLEAVKAWGEIELPKVNDWGSRNFTVLGQRFVKIVAFVT